MIWLGSHHVFDIVYESPDKDGFSTSCRSRDHTGKWMDPRHEQEARLVNHIKKMSHLEYGYTRTEVTTLATDYAVDLGLKGKDGKPLSLQ